MSAILGGQVSAGINGLAELAPQIRRRHRARPRHLQRRAGARRPDPDVPRAGCGRRAGELALARCASGISRVDRDRLEKAVDAMVRSAEWREALQRYRWMDRYLTGGGFTRFAQAEDQRVRAILTKLGLGSELSTESASGMYSLLVLARSGDLRLWQRWLNACAPARHHRAASTRLAGPTFAPRGTAGQATDD